MEGQKLKSSGSLFVPRTFGSIGVKDVLSIPEKSCWWKTLDFINVFTIFVGVNFLGLPYTVSVVGIIPAIVILCGIVVVTYHGCSLLLICKQTIEERRIKESDESIADLEKSLKLGYALLARDAFGYKGEMIVTISIFLIHFSFCVGYFIFLGNSMESLSEEFHRTKVCSTNGPQRRMYPANISKREVWPSDLNKTRVFDHGLLNLSDFSFFQYGNLSHDVELDCDFKPEDAPKFHHLVWFMCPFFVILCLPNLQILRDFLNILSFFTVIIVYLCLSGWLTKEMFEESFKPSTQLFVAEGILFTFGQAASTLEGMASITEVSDELHDGALHVRSYVAKTFAAAVPAYLLLGVLGYVVLGSEVKQVITHNLSPNEHLSLLVNFMVVCMILFGYPGMAYPGQKVLDQWCYQIITSQCFSKPRPPNESEEDGDVDGQSEGRSRYSSLEYLESRERHKYAAKLAKAISRVGFVVSTVALSTLFKRSFIYISAFTGAMDNCLLSLIFPAAIHTKVMMTELSNRTKVKNALVMILGVVLACVSVISFALIKFNVYMVSQN